MGIGSFLTVAICLYLIYHLAGPRANVRFRAEPECGCFEAVNGRCSHIPKPNYSHCGSDRGGGIRQCMAGSCVPNQCWGVHARTFEVEGRRVPVWIPLNDFTPCLGDGLCQDHVCRPLTSKEKEPPVYDDNEQDDGEADEQDCYEDCYEDEDDDDSITAARIRSMAGDDDGVMPPWLGARLFTHDCVRPASFHFEKFSWTIVTDGLPCPRGRGECYHGYCHKTNTTAPFCPPPICTRYATCSGDGSCEVTEESVWTGEEQRPGCVGQLPEHAVF